MIDLRKAPWRRGEPWVPVLSSAAVKHRAPEIIRTRVNPEGALVWRAAGASLPDLETVKISVTSMTKKPIAVRQRPKVARKSPRAVKRSEAAGQLQVSPRAQRSSQRRQAQAAGGRALPAVLGVGSVRQPTALLPPGAPEPLVVQMREPAPGLWNARVARVRALILEKRRRDGGAT